jgi:diguanylate cyclase (GGDEF)-like protein
LIVSITHPDDRRAVAAAYDADPARSASPVVARRIRPDGSTVWTETRLTPILDDTGRVVEIESIVRDVTASKESEADLAHRALHDPVTGLTNRYVFVSNLERAFDRQQRDQQPIVVMFCDLDRFKAVNDTLGHVAGDELLAEAARRLRRVVRPGDTLSRLGGDEFAILLEPVTETHAVGRAAERVLAAFREPFRLGEHEASATVSIGIALHRSGPADPTELLSHADAALYRAKEHGRNRYEVFDDALRDEMADRLDMENELYRAVARNEFLVYHQPIRHIQTGRITATEALLRWQHPTRGLLEARDFIRLAEDIGVTAELQPWALAVACGQQRAWRDRLGTGAPSLSVNVSARQLGTPGLRSTFSRVLDDTGVRPEDLTVELTESVLIEDPDTSRPLLAALKDLGLRVAVDNFGTGHSSLTHLRQFPIDTIKIDRAFVRELTTDLKDAAIVKAIITLAHALDVTTCAEGVETSCQLAALADLGCDLAQGYLMSPAVRAEEIDRLLVSGQGPGH